MQNTTRIMLNGRRKWAVVLIALFGLVLALLLNSNSFTEDEKNRDDFNTHYRIHSLPLPQSVVFAGQSIQLDDPDQQERYDRELLTNIYWQSQTLLFIKRAPKYFPLIEQILKQQGIPDDFKYLALAESGLQELVVSPSQAAGIWQFLDGTAKRYGLTVNEEIDERYHLEKATLAACAYFKESYAIFGDWALVAASYNMGIEGIRRQLTLQHAQTFQELYLNAETSRYLFRIIALKNILEHPQSFGFYVPQQQRYETVKTLVVALPTQVSDLATLAHKLNSNYKWLKALNPWLRKNQFDNKNPTPVYIKLPEKQVRQSVWAAAITNDTLFLNTAPDQK